MADLLDALVGSTRTRSDAEGRVFEFVAGIVKDVKDPDGLCRVRARVGGQHDDDTTNWLMPCLPGGVEALPKVDDLVIVGFLEGNPGKGFYLCSISSTQSGRPTEAMLLATTFVGMFNDLVAKFNTLKGKYNQAQADITAIVTMLNTTGLTVALGLAKAFPPLAPTSSTDADADAEKGKASDGSVPAAISDSRKVLSATQKVR